VAARYFFRFPNGAGHAFRAGSKNEFRTEGLKSFSFQGVLPINAVSFL
jgi:hypothetical protein